MHPNDTAAAPDSHAADLNPALLRPGQTPSGTGHLPALRRQFPGFDIWSESFGERTHYTARRRHPWVQPHTLVTSDPSELRDALASTPGHPFTDCPQAIGDDYPGWAVSYSSGRWSASCPAVTVHADTAEGLRAGIEQAICPDDDSP